jgi:hypothetical protein
MTRYAGLRLVCVLLLAAGWAGVEASAQAGPTVSLETLASASAARPASRFGWRCG